jgi:hypothetical protein
MTQRRLGGNARGPRATLRPIVASKGVVPQRKPGA